MPINFASQPPLTFDFFIECYKLPFSVNFIKNACLVLPSLHLEQYSLKNLTVTHIDIISIPMTKMIDLNKKYRQKTGATDVLSFPYNQGVLGEIYICPTEIFTNAKYFKNLPINELAEVLCHSILHLLDYKHNDRMFALQKELSSLLLKQPLIKTTSLH